MLSNTGLYISQTPRFEEVEKSEDFLSYAPISDLPLSSPASTLLDHSNPMSDSFLSYFTNSQSLDCMDDWMPQDTQVTIPALDTTDWESSNRESTSDLQSPFESPMMDWPSPISNNASDGDFSPVYLSSKNSPMSLGNDFYLSKSTNNISEYEFRTCTTLPEGQASPKRRSSSLETEIPNYSQEEIAKLWTIAFPDSQIPITAPQPEAISAIKVENPSTFHQKRKSISQIPSSEAGLLLSGKKRHVEEKEPRRCSKRTNSALSSTGSSSRPAKGSKINHNLIEKRYRSSLNEKISLLRDALPRSYSNSNSCNSSEDDEVFIKREDQGELDSQLSEGKQSTKGAVLSDAARYIRFLESKVSKLEARLSCVEAF